MSTFVPSHDPPLWWERCLGNPIVLVAVWSVIAAAQVLADPWLPGFQPSPSLGELPRWTAASLAATIGLGGVGAIVGLLNSWENRSRAWALERSGWLLSAVGWIAYAVVVLQGFPGSTISWGTALVLSAIGWLRITALRLMERRTRRIRAEIDAAITEPKEATRE
ncbi:hypothetical protein [Kocuria rhizophila]|uniref:hypothetical protein n=1 Tax=Kocuria rhizophila TaxID=72000 RepID=UPI001EF696D5|nr:hypothetical protein [Kocuria rhizophila]